MRVHATAFSAIRRRLRSIAVALSFAASCAPLAQALEWRVEVTPDGDVFPALAWSQRAAGVGGDGLVAVVATDVPSGAALRAQVQTPGLRADAVAVASSVGGAVTLRPRLAWDAAQMAALHETRSQHLRVMLENGNWRETRELEVRLHPLDEAAYFVLDGGAQVDLSWIFAGYVDPFSPAVDTLLADARKLDPAFDAAEAGAPHRRLRAVWQALAARGVRYDAADPALARGPSVWSQRVRSPVQVLRERRANCIDGSVLIASVLERLGLPARIALVPRHAFVGYRGPGGSVWLETTLLGSAGFDAAVRAGDVRWRKSASRFDGRHAPDYALIDVGTARAYGIIPIGAALRAAEHSHESAAVSATAR